MKWGLRNKRFFAVAGDTRKTVLAEVVRTRVGVPSLRILAAVDSPAADMETFPRLMAATTETVRGGLSMALPLDTFEIITVPMPAMPEGAIGKALPYNLAKMISTPLTDYVYDWQITKRQKDQIEITAYLFPSRTFESMRMAFAGKQLELTHFEADVFAAFAYLDRTGALKPDEITLCALIWPDNISMAVCEKGQIILVRTVTVVSPGPVPPGAGQPDAALYPGPGPADSGGGIEFPESGMEDSLLAGFDILPAGTSGGSAEEVLQQESGLGLSSAWEDAGSLPSAPPAGPDASLADYVEHISLEIMRTRDYHSSVLKGGSVRKVIVNGAEEFFDELAALTYSAMGMRIEPLARAAFDPNCPPAFQAICIGTGSRW